MNLINSIIDSLQWLITYLGLSTQDSLSDYIAPSYHQIDSLALIIRPTAQNRPIALEHAFAFQTSRIDAIRKSLFFSRMHSGDDAQHHQNMWTRAKAWWEELYGDSIENFDEPNEDQYFDQACKWYKQTILPLTTIPQSRHMSDAIKFIQYWWRQFSQECSSVMEQTHHNSLRQLLRRIHPDKGGCHQSMQLLLQWKSFKPALTRRVSSAQSLSTSHLYENTSRRAKPWHVLSIFSQHTMRVEIQCFKNQLGEKHLLEERIHKNAQTIADQNDQINNLKRLLSQLTDTTPIGSY